MSSDEPAEKFAAFKKILVAILKNHGFRIGGGEYVRDDGEGYCVLRLQNDKYNSNSRKALTINVGGGSEFLWRAVPIGFKTFEKRYGVVPFGRRIGWSTQEDKWYVVTSATIIDELVDDFNRRMKNEILPFAEKFATLHGVMMDLRSDHPSVPSEKLTWKYIEAIKEELERRKHQEWS